MKNQKGFIQIPILIAIIVGVIVVGGAGYVGVTQYQKYQAQKAEKEMLARELESLQQETQRREEMERDKQSSEIEALKKEIESVKKQNPTIIKVPSDSENSSDISSYASYIVKIICSNGSSATIGSGTIFGLNRAILTNAHVVEGAVLCSVGLTDDVSRPPSRWYEATVSVPGSSSDILGDIALLVPSKPLPPTTQTVAYNLCSHEDVKLGDAIVVLGYPTLGGDTITVTEGIVSGFERNIKDAASGFEGSFIVKTSAKLEYGNSGGGVFLKKYKCWFGIPTSVAQGEIESLGYIINYSTIHNYLYRDR